jgi:hypothetical protein
VEGTDSSAGEPVEDELEGIVDEPVGSADKDYLRESRINQVQYTDGEVLGYL